MDAARDAAAEHLLERDALPVEHRRPLRAVRLDPNRLVICALSHGSPRSRPIDQPRRNACAPRAVDLASAPGVASSRGVLRAGPERSTGERVQLVPGWPGFDRSLRLLGASDA